MAPSRQGLQRCLALCRAACGVATRPILLLLPCLCCRRCRKAAQDAAIKEHSERLESLGQMAAQLASRQEAVLRDQLEAVRRRHVQLCHQLLRVLRHVSRGGGRNGVGVCAAGLPIPHDFSHARLASSP